MIKPETKFKQFVRKKLGLTRVTKQAQQKVWTTLAQKNKNMYGGWKPVNVPNKALSVKSVPPVPTITLQPTNVCVLGQGAYGKVCVRKTPSGKKYAVKTPISSNGNNFEDLMNEKDTHMKFYYKLPEPLKKYFPKPVNVKGEPNVYAMTMFDGVTLREALKGYRSTEYKRNILKNLRKAVFAMWTSGYIHGDIHMENILVSKDGHIHILDFGMMRKSTLKVPNTKFKINGNVNYKNLTDEWKKWFRNSWNVQLKNLGLTAGNPNMIVFPHAMRKIKYYYTPNKNRFKKLNKYETAPSARGRVKKSLEMYKKLVRNRMGVKRVTREAQIALWNKLSNANKKQFGNWRPEGVVNRRTSPPKAKPTMNQYMMKAFMNEPNRADTLLRFWMTHYTQDQKRQIYNKVSDPEKAQRDFPLCK